MDRQESEALIFGIFEKEEFDDPSNQAEKCLQRTLLKLEEGTWVHDKYRQKFNEAFFGAFRCISRNPYSFEGNEFDVSIRMGPDAMDKHEKFIRTGAYGPFVGDSILVTVDLFPIKDTTAEPIRGEDLRAEGAIAAHIREQFQSISHSACTSGSYVYLHVRLRIGCEEVIYSRKARRGREAKLVYGFDIIHIYDDSPGNEPDMIFSVSRYIKCPC